MELFHKSIDILATIISLAGTVVIIWGVTDSFITFLKLKFSPRKSGEIPAEIRMRHKLGSNLVLGLEIFIAADIISSVGSPTWNKVGILASIVGIRTVLSFFLTKELQMVESTLTSAEEVDD